MLHYVTSAFLYQKSKTFTVIVAAHVGHLLYMTYSTLLVACSRVNRPHALT